MSEQDENEVEAVEDAKELERKWIRQYNMTEEQIAEIREAFATFDQNDDNVIATDQFGNVLRYIGQCPTIAQIKEMVDEAETSDNGTISLEEFVRVVGSKGILKGDSEMQEELEEALKVFDKDGKGYIHAKELEEALKGMGEPVDDDDIKEMLKLAGVDSSGNVNYYDLVTHMCAK